MDDHDFINKMFEFSTEQETYKKGAYIYHNDEIAQGVFKVLKGRVKLSKSSTVINRMITFYFVHPSGIFGTMEFFFHKRIRRCAAIAIDDEVIVQHIPYSEFERYMHIDPVGSLEIVQSMIKCSNICWDKCYELQRNDIVQRVFNTLETLATENGRMTEKGIEIEGMSHQELANYIGISRQSVSSSLSELREKKIIEYNRKCILIKRIF